MEMFSGGLAKGVGYLAKIDYFCARASGPLFICLPVQYSYIESCGVSTIVDAPFLFLAILAVGGI